MCLLAHCYHRGEQGLEQDYALAAAWYRRSAEIGWPEADWCIGNMYMNGEGVRKDLTVAVSLYRKAALQGDPDAQADLGALYLRGQGVEKSFSEGMMWYRKALAGLSWRIKFIIYTALYTLQILMVCANSCVLLMHVVMVAARLVTAVGEAIASCAMSFVLRVMSFMAWMRALVVAGLGALTLSSSPVAATPLCRVCWDKPVEMVVLPCSHVPVCRTCAAHPSITRCPVCRQPIQTSFRVFV